MTGPRSVDAADVIDSAPLSGLQKRVIAFCCLIALIDTYDTQSMAFTASSVAADWGVPVAAITPVFVAALVGMMVGGLLFGPLADRFGRRRMIIICAVVFGLGTLAVPLTDSLGPLMVIRFVTGIGVGGIFPNLIAMAAEYSPRRMRSTVVTVVGAGMILGGFVGGFVAAFLMPAFGWHSVFLVGGGLTVVLVVVAVFWLPESVQFLLVKGRTREAAQLVRQIDPATVTEETEVVASASTTEQRAPVSALFTGGRAAITLLLWVTFCLSLLVMYFLLNWLPSLIQIAGMSQTTGLVATALFNLGGAIGGIALGLATDRLRKPLPILFGAATLSVAAIVGMTFSLGSEALLLTAALLAGAGVAGSQNGLTAFASSRYPTEIRSTGVGWAIGIGRVGSIAGPVVGGGLIAAGLDGPAIVLLVAIPAAAILLCLLAIGAQGRRTRRRAPDAQVGLTA
ncbi:MFS transporter [Pseudonocardia pini]|uniref:MFS transporter n=1 Tax=Pseudonocardia pini TaxID=2758030 RepID=UPI0015F05B01|nr:MFS transporter [Pseudonocardia pini]